MDAPPGDRVKAMKAGVLAADGRGNGASLAALCLVRSLKESSRGIHCLKGNHDNGMISNLRDSAFSNSALEARGGRMAQIRYGEAICERFGATKGSSLWSRRGTVLRQPRGAGIRLGPRDLSNTGAADIVSALIWTANGEAEVESVQHTLSAILKPFIAEERGFWLSGHRPVDGTHALRARGRLVQIHNPERRQVAWIDNNPQAPKGLIDFYEIVGRKKELSLLETVALF